MTRDDLKIALLGNVTEYYNVTLCGFLSLHFAELYFPAEDKLISLMASIMTFAVGYFMRPLGGILLGYIGDTRGTQVAIFYSLLLGFVPAVAIGLLPTYDSIGILAPIILIILRMLQGISISGEWSALVVYILSNTPKEKSNFWGSIIGSTGFIGSMFAALAAGLSTWSVLPDYFWRLAFLVGGALSLYTIYCRYKIISEKLLISTPRLGITFTYLYELISQSKLYLFVAILLGATSGGCFSLGWLYTGSLYVRNFSIDQQTLAFIGLAYMFSWAVSLPVFGMIADRVGLKRCLRASFLAMIIFSYPAMVLIHEPSLYSLIIGQFLLTVPNWGVTACVNAFLFNYFPDKKRCVVIGFGYTLGLAVFGGTMPTIMMAISNVGRSDLISAFYISLLAMLCLMVSGFIMQQDGAPFNEGKKLKNALT